MTDLFVAVVVLLATGTMTAWVAHGIAQRQPLPVENYRGLQVTTGGGLAIVFGFLAGRAALGLVWQVAESTRGLEIASGAAQAATIGITFGLIGLLDDLLGDRTQRGWGAHLGALRRLQPTAGAIKIFASLAAAYEFSSPIASPRDRILTTLAIPLCANAANAFDLRPLRLAKFALLAAAASATSSFVGLGTLVIVGGAILAIAPAERQERLMLGDAGAYAIGAAIGGSVIVRSTGFGDDGLLVVFAVALGINVLAVKPGISTLIERVMPLRALDALGRRAADGAPPDRRGRC